MKHFLWFVWTVIAVGIFVSLSSTFGADVEHIGYDLVFTTNSNRYLEIEDEDEVVLEAASADFFAFHQESGEIIAGQLGNPPLGWEYEPYYFVDPTQIQPGKWSVEGDRTIYTHISNNDGFTAKEILVSQGAAVFGAIIITLIIWGVVTVAGAVSLPDN